MLKARFPEGTQETGAFCKVFFVDNPKGFSPKQKPSLLDGFLFLTELPGWGRIGLRPQADLLSSRFRF